MLRTSIAGVSGVVLLAAALPLSAHAAGGTGVYADWTFTSSTAGTVTVNNGGWPTATFTVSAGSGSRASGSTIYLNANTPVGGEYGSSRDKPYASIGLPGGFDVPGTASVMTLTFSAPMPATGWAFALGDVDAEDIRIAATDATGRALDVSGWFTSAFNYCNAGSPKPSGCPSGASTDIPVWNAPIITGNKVDTGGAAAWFRPTAAVKTLTFTQTRNIAGGPNYQLWIASDVGAAPVPPAPEPTESAEPTPSPTPTPTPTESEEATPEPTESSSPEAEPTPGPTTTPAPSPAPAPTTVQPIAVRPGEPVVIPLLELTGNAGGTIQEVAQPSNGTATIQGETVVYRPDSGYFGADVISATIVDRANNTVSVSVPVQVGEVQRPVRSVGLPASIQQGTTVLVPRPVRTNARQIARVNVICTLLTRAMPMGGGAPSCAVNRARGAVSITINSAAPVNVTVRLSAPAKGNYGPYEQIKRYRVR